MRGISTELKVGAFALVALAVLGFMTFRVGGMEWAKSKGYIVYVVFNNTAGLDQKTKVKIAGVDAGVIEGIELMKGRAKVTVRVDSGVVLYRNAQASVRSSGLLGDKFLSISIGTSDMQQLKAGETIDNVMEIADMDELARRFLAFADNFSNLTGALNEVLGTEESKASLRQTIVNLREVSASLNQAVSANDVRLRTTLDNINKLTTSLNDLVDANGDQITGTVSNMKEFSGDLKTGGHELIVNLNRAVAEFKAMVEENRPTVTNTVNSLSSITKQIEKGEGTFGKLIKDDRLYESVNRAADGLNKTLSTVDRFRTFITFQSDYLTKPKEAKGLFSVTLQPSPEKYYILGVVGDPVGRVTTTSTVTTPPGGTVTQDVIRKKIEFNAQFARRFGDAAARLGVTQNSFGVGGDYFFNKDKGRVTADIWDFGKDEDGATKPHVRVGMDYFIFRDVFISAGMDNVLNKKWRGGYVGIGLRFEDEDFKYLMGSMSRLPSN